MYSKYQKDHNTAQLRWRVGTENIEVHDFNKCSYLLSKNFKLNLSLHWMVKKYCDYIYHLSAKTEYFRAKELLLGIIIGQQA